MSTFPGRSRSRIRHSAAATALSLAACACHVGLARSDLPPTARSPCDVSRSATGEASSDGRDTPFLDRSVPARPGEALRLDLQDTGGEVWIFGWDRDTVQASVALGGRHARETRVTLETDEGGVRVVARYAGAAPSQHFEHLFVLHVPRRQNIRVLSASGPIHICGLQGKFVGATGTGDFVAERTYGYVEFETGGGAIRIVDSDISGSLRTGRGDVTILAAHTGVAADRAVPGTPAGKVPSRLAVRTGHGDINIGPLAGTADIWTGRGNVAVMIAGVGDPFIDIFSGTGRVVLDVPLGISAQFDLETAYTRAAPAPTRIESAIPLVISATEEWDPSRETPRRYIWGGSATGEGQGLVRVRTVNGDIVVRQATTPARGNHSSLQKPAVERSER